jgi:TusA-related sulfurtransferase
MDPAERGGRMGTHKLDFTGLKCPLPTLKLNQFAIKKQAATGDTVEVVADCSTFEMDVKKWCTDMKKVLVKFYVDGNLKTAQIRF